MTRAQVLLAVAVAALLAASSAAMRAASPPATEERLPERLEDTGINDHGRPFSPQYPLWTDGAAKSRWFHVPPGSTIDASDDAAWQFPVGTRFWKDFSFNGRKVETRMLWKKSADEWVAASYLWNADGTEATLAPAAGVITEVEVAPGRKHVVPSRDECLMCHGTRPTGPLGFSALQLSTDRDPNAIHGEPLQPGMATIQTLVEEGTLAGYRRDLLANPPRIKARDAGTRAMLGYLAANCGSCHNGRGEIAALGPVLKMTDLLTGGDAVARGLIAQRTNWQVPGLPEGASLLLDPATPEKSALIVRMRSRQPSTQMPPLGTAVRDEQALAAIRAWLDAGVAMSH